VKLYALRLKPEQDLKAEIIRFTQENGLQAGFIITCVGSLRCAALRLANHDETTYYDDKFEICSLVGTLDAEGVHLHVSLSDGTGQMIGGHLQEGSLIYTTAEIMLGEADDLRFTREFDPASGYPELVIRPRE
jgi:predicted DNA-binding protein with PD1-like motif